MDFIHVDLKYNKPILFEMKNQKQKDMIDRLTSYVILIICFLLLLTSLVLLDVF